MTGWIKQRIKRKAAQFRGVKDAYHLSWPGVFLDYAVYHIQDVIYFRERREGRRLHALEVAKARANGVAS